jgi:hypothetical protein
LRISNARGLQDHQQQRQCNTEAAVAHSDPPRNLQLG